MTDGVSESRIKWLTYLVYILLTVLTAVTGWNTLCVQAIPDKYVRLERYQTDQNRLERQLIQLNAKLDRLIERL